MCIFMICHTYSLHSHNQFIAMRTNIVIDDDLMKEAMELSRQKTKRATVEEGLRLLIYIRKQEHIRSLRGKIRWSGDSDEMRKDRT